ncbi:MAG: hypothetical protein IIA83_06935 [Thaumarchaeota archaeon]|nr:hypothetical protein [Nitrososphaerota archaeon]
MSETSILPFFHWGECNADSKINADRIDLEIVEAEPFDSTYSSNIKAKVTFDYHKDELMNIPLWNYKSKNQALLRQYMKQFEKGKIKDSDKIQILTWLGTSSKNPEFKLREWRIVV